MPEAVPYRPDKLLEVLERHGVQFVVIGGLAAELRGSPYATRDVNVTPSRERANLGRLADALRELDARLRISGVEGPVEFPLDQHSFDCGTTWTFVTTYGFLDIALLPDGTRGYDDLRRGASRERITDTLEVNIASLADVIRSKEAAGREKDRAVLPILRQVGSQNTVRDRLQGHREVSPWFASWKATCEGQDAAAKGSFL